MSQISEYFKAAAAIVALSASPTAAVAQNYTTTITIGGNDYPINCAALQGNQDVAPGDFTCGFVKEIDQHLVGAQATCSTEDGYLLDEMRSAAEHLARAHGQPALEMFQATQVSLETSKGDSRLAVQDLEQRFPGQGVKVFYTYIAINTMTELLGKGYSYDYASTYVDGKFKEWGRSPEEGGHDISSINELFTNNPVIRGRALCLQQYPDIPWSEYDR